MTGRCDGCGVPTMCGRSPCSKCERCHRFGVAITQIEKRQFA